MYLVKHLCNGHDRYKIWNGQFFRNIFFWPSFWCWIAWWPLLRLILLFWSRYFWEVHGSTGPPCIRACLCYYPGIGSRRKLIPGKQRNILWDIPLISQNPTRNSNYTCNVTLKFVLVQYYSYSNVTSVTRNSSVNRPVGYWFYVATANIWYVPCP